MVSLYACSNLSKIEIGKFNMPINEAKMKFLKFVEKNKLSVWKSEESEDKIIFRFQLENSEAHKNLNNLISNVAKVSNLIGNPPTKYCLIKEPLVESGEYLQTNSYCG